ncbi:hypothetical protein [Salinisphaera hydrothermalis]|uniref:Uncharacterized protein n=1 Tax=Salinisphaera hydrothermalis (strain C41B8) TaxID=1304275 RepID=A0A084IPE8_SALHC|nr:hypothetical protein [Salinisphaera hydrothermalis]KEZ78582.1 hypothetical protein C41B8_03166 [Salinisphaera hydrothermalis C41B8]
MDIVDTLRADHGYLRSLGRRILDELPRYVRARPHAAASLRMLVAGYVDYETRVHEPREACLRAYLAAQDGGAPRAGEGESAHDWITIRDRLASAMSAAARLELRHRLTAALRDGAELMQSEENDLLAQARCRLSAVERHALALRAMAGRMPA